LTYCGLAACAANGKTMLANRVTMAECFIVYPHKRQQYRTAGVQSYNG
jgi:hypothetical protein